MSSSLHAVFNVVPRKVYFFSYFKYSRSKNAIFCKSSKFHIRKIDFWSLFSTHKVVPGRGWLFPVSTFKEEFYDEKMSSLAGLNKKLFNFQQKYIICKLWATQVHLPSRISQRTGKNSKNPRSISLGRLLGTLCSILSFLSLLACRGRG